MMPVDNTLEKAIRHDRLIVIAALLVIIALSWAYLLAGSGLGMPALQMTRLAPFGMSAEMMRPVAWTPGYALLVFFMWWLMMLAMMLPSAAPAILLFATLNHGRHKHGHPHVATSIFAAGYLATWAGFSLLALTLQWALERTGTLSPMLVGTNLIVNGILLLAAGAYQLTPIKHACLRHCRAPLAFLSTHWRRGARGALRMGLLHGSYCVGCCWFLMGLLFFGGVMNLYWIAGLAIYVLLEKTLPAGHWLGYLTGVALLVWGSALLALAI